MSTRNFQRRTERVHPTRPRRNAVDDTVPIPPLSARPRLWCGAIEHCWLVKGVVSCVIFRWVHRVEPCYEEQRNTTAPFPTPVSCTTQRMLKTHVTFVETSRPETSTVPPGAASMPAAIFCTWGAGDHHARVLHTSPTSYIPRRSRQAVYPTGASLRQLNRYL